MYTILMLNQKGGVGKTTIADELAFALERRGKTVAFVTVDSQGGATNEACDDPDYIETCDYQVVDTPGVIKEGVEDWCRAADLILVPVLPSTRDTEATMRTLGVIRESGTSAKAFAIINCFYAYGILDRGLVDFFTGEGIPVLTKVPRTADLSKAAAAGVSVAEFAPRNKAVEVFDKLAEKVCEGLEEGNGQ